MGRSVMTHPNAEVTAYLSWAEDHVSFCRYCEEEVVQTYDGWVLESDTDATYCPVRALELTGDYNTAFEDIEAQAKHEGYEYDSENFENDLDYTRDYLLELWPSLESADRWPYNEVHVIAENRLVEVSISEYGGLVALCIAPRTDLYEDTSGLAKGWIKAISGRFLSAFGSYAKLGTFSNGESAYLKEE